MEQLLFNLNNLQIALRYWITVPEKNVVYCLADWNNNSFKSGEPATHDCNTIACFGGWVSGMPEFIAMGVKKSANGSPSIVVQKGKKQLLSMILM